MRTFSTPIRKPAVVRRHPGPRTARPAAPAPAARRSEIHNILHGPRLQAELTIGAPDDAYEREADRVADAVMRMPEERVQRAQVGRIHTPAGTTPHFLYELDATRFTFSQLAGHYGVRTRDIQNLNPGARPSALRRGQQIRVPAFNPPAPSSRPFGPGVPSIIQSTRTHLIPIRWNSGANDNRVGALKRGTPIGTVGGGAEVLLASLRNVAQGVLSELRLRGMASTADVFAYPPAANVRSLLVGPTAADVNLIARMIWGEQRSQGAAAMTAAAWIAKNRFDTGWGGYSQIITRQQFHGLATPAQVTGLTGPNLQTWNRAQQIAGQVAAGTIADPTGGAVYFGNDVPGSNVLTRMRSCAQNNAAFRYGRISGTNFYYSNGDYTSASCTIP